MDIKREEATGDHPRRRRERPADDTGEGQDQATISITALRAFLAALIGGGDMAGGLKTYGETYGETYGTRAPAPSPAARAAQAYQSTTRTPYAPPAPPPATATADPALAPADEAAIRALLPLLHRLETLHITELAVEGIESGFIQSLRAAAEKALQRASL